MFPAPAGINRGTEHAVYISTSVPRASGDKPPVEPPRIYTRLCSPRQRG
ncbi:hypothetical protein ECDEC10A_3832 [Escherichia coli DEC10A]|nr:hypothetical protein ECDEC10A_3832 [Escherichia coli DEC10A]